MLLLPIKFDITKQLFICMFSHQCDKKQLLVKVIFDNSVILIFETKLEQQLLKVMLLQAPAQKAPLFEPSI